jgi:hypothetical protein
MQWFACFIEKVDFGCVCGETPELPREISF